MNLSSEGVIVAFDYWGARGRVSTCLRSTNSQTRCVVLLSRIKRGPEEPNLLKVEISKVETGMFVRKFKVKRVLKCRDVRGLESKMV